MWLGEHRVHERRNYSVACSIFRFEIEERLLPINVSAKKRVLIVDDSVVVRKALSDLLSRDPELEVAGLASNGRIALAKLPTVRPDLILLDIEMPEMNGLETLPEIRKIQPLVPIIMFSTLTERGASATLDALSLAATDYVTKPSNFNAEATSQSITEQLIPKIKALCLASAGNADLTSKPRSLPIPRVLPNIQLRSFRERGTRIEIVAVGVSTGGPEALAKFLPMFPADFSVPIVIAQHMPPIFTALLAQRLSGKCSLPVRECKSGELLAPGSIWIAAGDYHMVLERSNGAVHLRSNRGPRENFCRPSVDVLFRSVAEAFGSRALAVVLTGMGQDGLKGCQSLVSKGAQIVVQDEASSVVWGMPGFVARSGLASKILPLAEIAPEIIRSVSSHAAPVRLN